MTASFRQTMQPGKAKMGDGAGDRAAERAAHHAARLLVAHPERDWRLAELAALVHLSPSQLGRTFHQHFGTSPMRYLALIRAHRLAQMLRDTDLPIGVAMRHVGWRSRGHAARQFAAIIGVSPSTYRASELSRSRMESYCYPEVNHADHTAIEHHPPT